MEQVNRDDFWVLRYDGNNKNMSARSSQWRIRCLGCCTYRFQEKGFQDNVLHHQSIDIVNFQKIENATSLNMAQDIFENSHVSDEKLKKAC